MVKQIEKVRADLERQKFDLQDQIDSKQEQIGKLFDTELEGTRQKYEESIELVTEASKNLGQLFKDKMVKMKSKLAKYFADTDI